jgi:sugar porter (SP) family MFS transporter
MGLSSSKLDGAEATAVAQKKGEHVQLVVQSEQLQDKTRRREMMTFNLIFATILIASQSLVYGMLLGGLNASLVTGAADSGEACFSNVDPTCPAGSIYKDFNLSTMEASTAVALLFVTGWAASLTANSPLERLGRKTTLILNSCLFLIGAALSSCGNYYTLFLGRIVLGWGGGTVTVMVPVLLSEIADRHTRGTITAVYQVTVTCGIFTVGVVGYLFIKNFAHGWQVVQAMPGLPPLLLLSFQSYIPESPKWLVRRGREEDARAVLKTLRPATYDVEQEIEAAEAQMGADAHHMQKRATWGDVFRPSPWRMIMGCTLMWLQSITGINSITFYSTTIFRFAGFNQPILATVSTGGINFLMSFVAFTVSDKVGRKTLVFGGACVMWCALLTISTVLLDDNSQPQLQGYFCVAGVSAYTCLFIC